MNSKPHFFQSQVDALSNNGITEIFSAVSLPSFVGLEMNPLGLPYGMTAVTPESDLRSAGLSGNA